MKKFLCVVISALLVLTSSSFVALAKKDENVTKKENAQIEVRDESKKDNFSDKKAEKDKNEKEKEKQEKTEKESIEEKKPHDKKSDDKKTDEVKTDKQKDEKGKEKADKKVHKTKEQKREEIKKAVNEKRSKNDNSIPLFVKGKDVKFDVPPVIKDGRTLIPVRAVTNALGATVEWDEKSKTITVSKAVYSSVYGASTTVIEINLDSDIVIVNGEKVKIDVPAQLVNNRTMVPLRFIAQVLKQSVEWDEELSAVIIDDDDEDDIDVDELIKAFRKELKAKHNNKHARKALIKELSKLKKKNNDKLIPVFVNGEDIEFDVPPVIKDGRTLIPVRAVTNALGATVEWYSETKTVNIKKTVSESVYGKTTTTSIEITLDSNIVVVNGKMVEIDVPAQLVDNRTMVPLRFISTILNKDIEWDEETGAIIIEDVDND
ncbi:copper amine oxidase N-terminal domain-containing protein [Acetivibrio mesophilus]|nr:copper amine oxidase N-terminal domain-containing protein [Acetivibrio mesophilus]